jgi:hypothetical protein
MKPGSAGRGRAGNLARDGCRPDMGSSAKRGCTSVSSRAPGKVLRTPGWRSPQNNSPLLIDYQPKPDSGGHIDQSRLPVWKIVSVARLAKTYWLPIVVSTVNVAANGHSPTNPELRDSLRTRPR